MKKLLVSCILVLCLTLACASALAYDATVSDDSQLADALTKLTTGTNTITLAPNSTFSGTHIIHQEEGKNIVIKGDGNSTVFTGQFLIYGHSRSDKSETLTFENIIFDGTSKTAYHYFIEQNSTAEDQRYAHNVTVRGCTFLDNDQQVVCVRIRQGYNITVENCKATNVFSLVWTTGGNTFKVIDSVLTGAKEGIHLGATPNTTVTGSNISSSTYGIRYDLEGSNLNANVEGNTIQADTPVVLRFDDSKYDPPHGEHTLNIKDNTFVVTDTARTDWLSTVGQVVMQDIELPYGLGTTSNDLYIGALPGAGVVSSSHSHPKTGDETNLVLLAVLLVASALGMTFMRKKVCR